MALKTFADILSRMTDLSGAVVLLSGGQDSATCLAVALRDEVGPIYALAFDYGQRHRVELDCARELATMAGIPIRMIDMRFIAQLAPNALTDASQDILAMPGELPSTFVPGRNLFFLSVAAVMVRQWGVGKIYTGVCQTDYSGYPDCREDFVQSVQQTVRLALDEPALEIVTPLMHLTKAQTVLLMKDTGHLDWYAHTHTCYVGTRPACGTCPACVLRLNGFRESGITDPLAYA